jgi:hypothetical protein
MKNFLFESDVLSLEEQKELLKERRDILSMATYSGNKSIHFIVQIKDYPETIEEYHYVWKLLKDKYFPNADTQCNDCIRLLRTPNGVRGDTDKRQLLLFNSLRPLYNVIQTYRNMSLEYRKTITIRRNVFYRANIPKGGGMK